MKDSRSIVCVALVVAASSCSSTTTTNVTAETTGTTGGTPSTSSGGSNQVGGASSTNSITAASGTPSVGGATSTVLVTGGANTGGANTGGANTGGADTGGANTGGANTGGADTGGANTGGADTGGVNAGGANTGGANTGGANTGGANTGGANTGGANTGGANTGGADTGGTSTNGTTTQSALLQNCTLLFHMDEASWSGTTAEVIDASGNNNNGTAMNGATTSDRAKFGKAGLFDSQYVSVGNNATLHGLSAFTVSAWVYPTGLDGSKSPGILAKRWAYGDRTELSVFLWSENRLFVDVDGESDRFASNAQFVNNLWYHVAVVFDGSLPTDQRVSVYVNGQLDSIHTETSSAIGQYDSPLEVGRLRNGGDAFVGSLDEVAFWQRALSSAEVAAIFSSPVPLQ